MGDDNLPGPLAQLCLGRDGTFFVVAAGRASHAGVGNWQGITTGNSSFIGIEAENTGLTTGPKADPWPDVQLDAYRRGVAAILKKIGANAIMCCGHKEYALPPSRKSDPTLNMPDFRTQVAAIMAGTAPFASVIPATDGAGRPTLRRGARGDLVVQLQRNLGLEPDGIFGPGTEAALRQFQRDHGLVPDGIAGPRAWATLEAKPAVSAAAVPPAAAPSDPIEQILKIAAASDIARFKWENRGRAPAGYIKGMALAYARVHCKLKAGDAAATEMAKAKTADPKRDALAWYDDIFAAQGMSNDAAGKDTLRHLFVLLIGLGMRESSGKHCEGRDKSATNTKSDTAEAGLFQMSFNSKAASPLLPTLFAQYSAKPSGFLEVFKEGVRCSAASLENLGSGDGKEFQRLCKECPAFAAEFAAVALRHIKDHWGPIKRKEAQVRKECDLMLRQVQEAVDASSTICSALV